jgi:uncharacterized Fe-S cluster-containing radical SAM superfamily protein
MSALEEPQAPAYDASTVELPSPPLASIRKREKSQNRRVPKGYDSVDGILLTEPRIEAIRRELQALLQLVQIEVDGAPVEVDGFRLRNPRDWADFPTSLSDIFWHLSSVCNFNCEFCYEKGNPEGFPIQNTTRMATLSEVDTRLRYYDPVRRRGIFSVRSSINEPFVNKNAVEVLRRVRTASPNELLSFVSNGSLLSDEAIDAIAELSPIFFNLSLYSIDPEVRRRVLADPRPNAAEQAVRRLREVGVPFMANLVMWPSIPFEDMERTIRFLDEQGAALIRVCLGGYSRYLSGDFERFETGTYWPKVVNAVEILRPSCKAPVLIEPNNFVRRDDTPEIDGVIAGSPADRAGLKRGDRIVSVNGRPVFTRMQLASALRNASGAGATRFRPPGVSAALNNVEAAKGLVLHLTLDQASSMQNVTLERHEPDAMASYPYAAIADFDDFLCGLVVTDGLQYSALKRAREIIDLEGAAKTLVLTSTMMCGIVREMANKSGAFAGRQVFIEPAQNNYFGGSINIGDLLVVSDFVEAIRRFREQGGAPDLVLVPSSPFASSPWQRDLCGVPWTEIERISGVSARLVPCQTITF